MNRILHVFCFERNMFLNGMRLALDVALKGERRGEHGVLVGSYEGKRPLGRHRRRWEDNIKIDLLEMGWGCMDWIDLAQDTLHA